MEINKPAIRKWVERLRDPNAKQGRDTLGTTNGERCCLGVVCDIAVEEGVIAPPVPSHEESTVLEYEGIASYLPEKVREWLGFEVRNPRLYLPLGKPELHRNRTAAGMNDSGEYSFSDIADAIEYTYLRNEKSESE